ncbi:MAG: hypothetical protein ACRD0G_14805 [Acidimicrobiales bacterium]
MPTTGRCPSCGIQLAEPQDLEDDEDLKPPWHFWVMVVLASVYLGWRLLQLVGIL